MKLLANTKFRRYSSLKACIKADAAKLLLGIIIISSVFSCLFLCGQNTTNCGASPELHDIAAPDIARLTLFHSACSLSCVPSSSSKISPLSSNISHLDSNGGANSLSAFFRNVFKGKEDKTVVDIFAFGNSTVGLYADGSVILAGRDPGHEGELDEWTDIKSVYGSWEDIIGLTNDGNIVYAGNNPYATMDFSGWEKITDLSYSGIHCIGLKKGGTVLSTGDNNYGQREVDDWADIEKVVAVSCGSGAYTYGLGKDGTVMESCGEWRQDGGWTAEDVVDIESSGWLTLALRNDGTVVGSGEDYDHLKDTISTWRNIVQIYPDDNLALGLTASGSVVSTLDDKTLNAWKKYSDIVSISGNHSRVIAALRSNGKVLVYYDGNLYDENTFDTSSWENVVKVVVGSGHIVGLTSDGTVLATGDNSYGQCDVLEWTEAGRTAVEKAKELRMQQPNTTISAGNVHVVGLKADGTVVAFGSNDNGQCNVSDWRDIVSVSAGWTHTLGLKGDGTVLAAGDNSFGQCEVSGWKDIVAISAGQILSAGLRADGTVVATPCKFIDYDVSNWRDIVAISSSNSHIVGLRADGTVLATGDDTYGQCSVSDWKDIVAISAGAFHTVGLKSDGTLVAVGRNYFSQCDVDDWKGIDSISAGKFLTLGLKDDGTVLSTEDNEYKTNLPTAWEDIAAFSAGGIVLLGLNSQGEVFFSGSSLNDEDVWHNWTDIMMPEAISSFFSFGSAKEPSDEPSTDIEIDLELIIGTWANESALSDDPASSYSGGYFTQFKEDGSVIQSGWRNLDSGHYEIDKSNNIIATFDHNLFYSPNVADYVSLDGYSYTVVYQYNAEDGTMYADYSAEFEESLSSNAKDGVLYRQDNMEIG